MQHTDALEEWTFPFSRIDAVQAVIECFHYIRKCVREDRLRNIDNRERMAVCVGKANRTESR